MESIENLLLNYVDIGLIGCDKDGNITYSNSLVDSIFGDNDLLLTLSDIEDTLGVTLETDEARVDLDVKLFNKNYTVSVMRVTGDTLSRIVVLKDVTEKTAFMENSNKHLINAMFNIRSKLTPVRNAFSILESFYDSISEDERNSLFSALSMDITFIDSFFDTTRYIFLISTDSIKKYSNPLPINACSFVDIVTKKYLIDIKGNILENIKFNNNISEDLQILIDEEHFKYVLSILFRESFEILSAGYDLSITSYEKDEIEFISFKFLTIYDISNIGKIFREMSSVDINSNDNFSDNTLAWELFVVRNILANVGGNIEFVSDKGSIEVLLKFKGVK